MGLSHCVPEAPLHPRFAIHLKAWCSRQAAMPTSRALMMASASPTMLEHLRESRADHRGLPYPRCRLGAPYGLGTAKAMGEMVSGDM
jgi:hypothetical protein